MVSVCRFSVRCVGFVDTEPISAVGCNRSCHNAGVAVATVECHISRIRALCCGLNKGAHLCLLILEDGERRKESSFFWWVDGQEESITGILKSRLLFQSSASTLSIPTLAPISEENAELC